MASGLGRGSYFISLDWVRARLAALMGADPYPGTLNLRIPRELRAELFSRRRQFSAVSAPGSETCSGYLAVSHLSLPRGQQLQAWVILPELTLHPDILEIVSPYSLRERMSLSDGDCVTIEVNL